MKENEILVAFRDMLDTICCSLQGFLNCKAVAACPVVQPETQITLSCVVNLHTYTTVSK